MSLYNIDFKPEALNQIKLMLENDPTLEKKMLRIQISGKKCEGFLYDIGFDEMKENDVVTSKEGVTIIMQPFTAHFCKDLSIDFTFDPENNLEGFSVINNDQENYQGKFFKGMELKL